MKTPVIVVPAGTFRLGGMVRESQPPGLRRPRRGDVRDGTGLATTTAGTYRLYGVAGDIEILVTAGRVPRTEKASPGREPPATVDFDLQLSRPRADVAGTYTLESPPPPSAVRCCRRKPEPDLTAVVAGGPRLTVVLEGSRFFADRGRTFNRFIGIAEPEPCHVLPQGTYDFYYSSYGPDVLEQLSDTTLFTMSGFALTTVSSAGLSGTLDGLIEAVQGTEPGRLQRIASCSSTGHQFVLSR